MRRAAAAAAVGCLSLFAAPVVQAATVEVGEQCYAEGDRLAVDGTGYTPGGKVRLELEKADGTVLETSEDPVAEPDGAVSGEYGIKEETGWFTGARTRFEMTLRLTDLTDQSIFASTKFIFSRWNVGIRASGGKLRPRRRARITAIGYTNAVGKPLFAHWMRKGRRVHTRRLGVLSGPCGDLKAKLRHGFPFRPVRPGRYEVRFTPSRTNTTKSAVRHRAGRVKRRVG